MMSMPSFDVKLNNDVSLAWDKMQQKASELGITFIGSEREGRFFGSGIVGHYTVKDRVVTVTITVLEFPASLVYDKVTIQDKLAEFFMSAVTKETG